MIVTLFNHPFIFGPIQIAGLVALVILVGMYVAEAIIKKRRRPK